jgi:putative multiple sugar transport system substrate-binding protein
MKKILALLLALTMVFALAACGQQAAPAASESNLVGVAMPTKDLQRWNQDGENMKAMLEKAGYAVDLQYGANDIATQVSQIENMIANGCKVLVIASIDGDSLGTVLAQAKEKGIPVIAYDRLIMNSDAVSYYATFDNWLVGTKQGEFIEAELGLKDGKGPFNIEFITGDPGDNNINFFFDGAMSILQKYLDNGQLVCPSGQTEKAVVATANWATDAAQARFENILSSYYADKQLDAVLASNDSTACGVENALTSSYTGKWPVITGQDCDIAIMANLINGKQGMSVFKDTRTLAAKVVEMVEAIMKGQEPPINDTETYDNGTGIIPSFLCEPVACTVENYKELLIDSGYYTYDQLGIDPNAAPAPAPAAASYKLGMGVSLSMNSSKAGNAQVDATTAAVVLDAEGKIVAAKIDVAQDKMDVTDGAVDTEKAFQTKKELKEDYGMSKIGAKEWYLQAEAFEAYIIGKTADEVEAMETVVNESGHTVTTDEALYASCSISIGDFKEAVVKACRDEQGMEFTAAGDFALGLAINSTADESVAATKDEEGVVKMYSEYAAAVVDKDGKILAALTDATQPQIKIDANGEIGDCTFKGTKRELKEGYNMVAFSAATMEWYEQARNFVEYVVGKTADEVLAIETVLNEEGHQVAVDETLLAGVTISIDGMMNVVAKAVGNAA